MENRGLNITVKCPICGWRIIDKLSLTYGVIKVKCPKCRKEVSIDLALRIAKSYSNIYKAGN